MCDGPIAVRPVAAARTECKGMPAGGLPLLKGCTASARSRLVSDCCTIAAYHSSWQSSDLGGVVVSSSTCQQHRHLGCVSLYPKSSRVPRLAGALARGDACLFLRFPAADYREKIWDHAAGAVIVIESGGRISDGSGAPLDFGRGR